jgi:hypothetical protein
LAQHLAHFEGGRLTLSVQEDAAVRVGIEENALWTASYALHESIEAASGICGGDQGNNDVVFGVWANKFSPMLVWNGKEIGSEHLHRSNLQLWVIQQCVQLRRTAGQQILPKILFAAEIPANTLTRLHLSPKRPQRLFRQIFAM